MYIITWITNPNIRYITTFSTRVGLYSYKRLSYGTNAAAEIFQYTLQTALQGLKGVKNIADEIIVFGSTRTEHVDANLDKCLQRLAMKGLRLKRSKCNFLSNTLSFFGQVFSKGGTHPDPRSMGVAKGGKGGGAVARPPQSFEKPFF